MFRRVQSIFCCPKGKSGSRLPCKVPPNQGFCHTNWDLHLFSTKPYALTHAKQDLVATPTALWTRAELIASLCESIPTTIMLRLQASLKHNDTPLPTVLGQTIGPPK